MNILELNKLKEALSNIFKPKEDFITARNDLGSKIAEGNKIHYASVNNELEQNQKKITSEVRSKNITLEEGKILIKNIREQHELKIKDLESSKDNSLFEEYEKKYKTPVEIKGFKSEILTFNKDNKDHSEIIGYNKKYDSSMFWIDFSFKRVGKNKIYTNILGIHVKDMNDNFIYLSMNIGLNKEIDLQHISINNEGKKIKISNYELDSKGVAILSTIKEEDLLKLNCPDRDEISLLLHDISLNIGDMPIYETFKQGLKDFQDTIKKELLLEKKITNKI